MVPDSLEGTEDPAVISSALVDLMLCWHEEVNPKKLSLHVDSYSADHPCCLRYNISAACSRAPETQWETRAGLPRDFRPCPDSSGDKPKCFSSQPRADLKYDT